MSERNLTRAFRRATGISVHAYRERVRLERAKDLLRNPELTVEAVAEACGYADVRQLRRVWNAAHGAPPRRPAARGGKG
ncbi:helix-turn-helix domain-containing protein [Cystobacter fuscus]